MNRRIINQTSKNKGQKRNEVYQPKTIDEAINNLHSFLDSDLYTKFRAGQKLPTGKKGKLQMWYRRDVIKDEKDFSRYLDAHFNILRDEIKKIRRKA